MATEAKSAQSSAKCKGFCNIYGIITAIMLLAVGACLIAGCLYVYFSKGTYNRDIVAGVFSVIRIPVFVCIALAVFGLILEILFPVQEPSVKADVYAIRLSRLRKTKDLGSNPEAASCIEKEVSSRRTRKLTSMLIMLASACIFLIYSLNGGNWENGELITDSVVKATLVLLACGVIPFTFILITTKLDRKSVLREIDLLKTLENKVVSDTTEETTNRQKTVVIIRICLFLVAIAVLIYGLASGGTADVLAKAKAICTECVGLG